MLKRAKGFSSQRKYVPIESSVSQRKYVPLVGLQNDRDLDDDQISEILATAKPTKQKEKEKYDFSGALSSAQYQEEFNLLRGQLYNILTDTERYRLFLQEYGFTDDDIYREILEYQSAINEAIANKNYNDMKNLSYQWDPNSEILKRIRGEWSENSVRPFGELPFYPTNEFVDPEEIVNDKLMRRRFFEKQVSKKSEEPYQPVVLFQKYLDEKNK